MNKFPTWEELKTQHYPQELVKKSPVGLIESNDKNVLANYKNLVSLKNLAVAQSLNIEHSVSQIQNIRAKAIENYQSNISIKK